MKLKSLKVKNFRGYRDETEINFDNLTAFIGKNDAGKSTILEALEIFFNNSLVVCEREDLSTDSTDNIMEITCTFNNLPKNITLDSTSTTTLKNEFLLNLEGNLEIKKCFKATSAKPKPTTYIVCNHPNAKNCHNLLELKNKDLKALAKSLDLAPSSYQANSNPSIRAAIWNSLENLELQLTNLQVDKEDSKKIYESLEKFLPIYALFQSDRPSKDDDKEVTDPMKLAVQQALAELNTEIEKIKEDVKLKAVRTAERTLEKLKEMDSELASTLIPEFKSEPKFDSLFKLTINSDDNIPINKRGSGVRRLILLNFFRAEVERKLQEGTSQNVIYAFEEPETSQHPRHQEMLIQAFMELAYNTNSQIILTTHTPALGSLLPLESLRFITKESGKRMIKQGEDSVFEEIANTLGILPDPLTQNTKALLLLEGQGDVVFIRHLCEKLKEGGTIPYTLQDAGFALVPTGGCDNLKAWSTLKLAEQFNIPWCVLLDSDIGMNESRKNLETKEKLEKQGIKIYLTRKREPENYIHSDCFSEYGLSLTFTDTEDAKVTINKHTRISKTKALETFWPLMSHENIRESERYTLETGEEGFEFSEMILDFLTLVDNKVTSPA
ncbi:AAA family ATPase [Bacillus sp. REN10]|uniref:AAA family ATPase n=1 Tax=Bacillus sp. REN10 TaxID=2782541 RepID=UPI00193C1159|nr:AAA family ATPase [Bacillus sp. REN10]